MADFLSRLSQRALGDGAIVLPGTPSRFAPSPAVHRLGEAIEFREEIDSVKSTRDIQPAARIEPPGERAGARQSLTGEAGRDHLSHLEERSAQSDLVPRDRWQPEHERTPAHLNRGDDRFDDADSAMPPESGMAANVDDSREDRHSEPAASTMRTVERWSGDRQQNDSEESGRTGDRYLSNPGDRDSENEQPLVPIERLEVGRAFDTENGRSANREERSDDDSPLLVPRARVATPAHMAAEDADGFDDRNGSTMPQSRASEPAQSPPTIQVTIGRIEVRLTTPRHADTRRPASPEPALSLDAYLGQHSGQGS